jgi:2-polyprenyl-3-methyl-5-hydroxy-6-metoxy-1,4-benzoquinol methylase
MARDPDWLALWTELVDMQQRWRDRRVKGDAWAGRAQGYRQRVKRRWMAPDSSRKIVRSWLGPGVSILDIGAGSGSWSALFANTGARVTALEPSPAMREALADTLAEEGASDVTVVPASWPGAEIEPHDVVFCSHAMYGCRDLEAFVRAMEKTAERTCALLLRVPVHGAPMAEAARLVLGHPHDSANFVVAFNALLAMGVVPHVHVEDRGPWGAWSHATLEGALADVKGRLGLAPGPCDHDPQLEAILRRHLTRCEEGWRWPPTMLSALVWWGV